MGSSCLLAAALAVLSVSCLSVMSLLCLRCKRKSKIIQEEHQTYNTQTFEREGSMFAVTRSKTVTRADLTMSTTVEACDELSAAAIVEQENYENFIMAWRGSVDHMYVSPIPCSLYENVDAADQTPGVYANFESPSIKDDEDDYENSEFLDKVLEKQEDDEPDYVNENGD